MIDRMVEIPSFNLLLSLIKLRMRDLFARERSFTSVMSRYGALKEVKCGHRSRIYFSFIEPVITSLYYSED